VLFLLRDPGCKSGSGINVPDHISESLVTIFRFRILKFFVSSVLRIRIRDSVLL
jgi:hypothetical protein